MRRAVRPREWESPALPPVGQRRHLPRHALCERVGPVASAGARMRAESYRIDVCPRATHAVNCWATQTLFRAGFKIGSGGPPLLARVRAFQDHSHAFLREGPLAVPRPNAMALQTTMSAVWQGTRSDSVPSILHNDHIP